MIDDDAVLPEPSKLTQTKERWAREGRLPSRIQTHPNPERLPPGQHAVTDWPVLDLGETPEVAHNEWRLEMIGAVFQPAIWNWEQLMQQPRSVARTDIHCVTSWSRYDNEWEGISTLDLIDAVQPHGNAQFVVLHSYDGYTTNLTIEDFMTEGAMLVYAWNGAPLTASHGGPARLVVPHLYFWKSAKWIRKIEFRTKDAPGFWETRGYHNRGDPWNEERYS
jgi:DMSO/TMAO reductase YedYZ molybdopterin-dependent catalytic subunit